MIEVTSRLRKWGNSFGIVLPINKLKGSGMREGEEVTAFIIRRRKTNLMKLFGKHKFKNSTEKIMREIDRELYDG